MLLNMRGSSRRLRRNLAPVLGARIPAMICLDDGKSDDVLFAVPAAANGMRLTCFVIASRVANLAYPDYLTAAQINALHAAGHEIAGHSYNHDDLTTLTSQQVADDCALTISTIQGIVTDPLYRCLSMAYPSHKHNAAVRAVVKQYFRGARNGLASGDAPAGAGQLFSAYLYQFPTFKDLANITNSTLNDEATIRADVRASLTSCYNADIAYIASGHIVDNCTVAQMGYICNEIALDTRFVPMTFGQFADWLSQRASMSADLEQWKTPYVAWTHWRSADLTKMTVTVIPGGGPDGLDCVRLQNPSGSDVLYSFNNARITGETMTASCWVKSDTGSSQASAYAIRCSGQQSSLFTANTGWVRAQFAATAPTSTTTSSSGVNVKAGKSLYLAMYQLELGSGATAYEHPPL